jgi:hypothetical protein
MSNAGQGMSNVEGRSIDIRHSSLDIHKKSPQQTGFFI